MKDYIYLDIDMLNSTLAQLDEGLLNGYSESSDQGSSRSESSSKDSSKGIEGVFQFGARYVKELSESSAIELTKSQSRALDYVLNDYAVDVLLDRIQSFTNFSNDISIASEGDYVHFEGDFRLFDFQLLKKITSADTIGLLFEDNTSEMNELQKKIDILKAQNKKNPIIKQQLNEQQELLKKAKQQQSENKDGLEIMNKAASFADNILGGSIFIQTTSSLSLCKRECFRLSQGQLSMLAETKRKLTVLALVSSIKDETHIDGNFNEFNPHDLNKIPSMFTDMFLSNFNLIYDGDRILTPIALFFE